VSAPACRLHAVGWSPWGAVAGLPELEVLFVPGLPVRGLYAPHLQAIAIRTGQTRRMRRSVLAEELGHHELGHHPRSDRREVARMELRARRWAARQLISLHGLADALTAASWEQAAEQLDVDVALLHTRTACLTVGEVRELRRLVGRREMGL
jgi:hypothetical protein